MQWNRDIINNINIMFVDIDLKYALIFRRNIIHRNRFIRLAVFLWWNYNSVDLMYVRSILGTLTYIILLDFD